MREGSDECALAGRGSAEEGRFQLGLGTNETRRESKVKVRRCELVEEALWALALLEWGGQARGKEGYWDGAWKSWFCIFMLWWEEVQRSKVFLGFGHHRNAMLLHPSSNAPYWFCFCFVPSRACKGGRVLPPRTGISIE